MQIFEATINKLRPEQIDGFVFLMTSKIQDKNRCYNHNFKNLLYMLFFNDASDSIRLKKILGQKLEDDQAEAIVNYNPNAPLYERLMVNHRRALGFFIPFIFWQTIWWILAISVSLVKKPYVAKMQFFVRKIH
jgi:hypothetical protein